MNSNKTIKRLIHFQKPDLSCLCDGITNTYKTGVTNDKDSVTCKICISILKDEKSNKLKEILNKKILSNEELDKELNYMESGYDELS